MDKTLGYEPRDVKVRILLESQIEYHFNERRGNLAGAKASLEN